MKNEVESGIVKIFGKNVRHYRILKHYTQSQLAQKINRTEETISNIERGISVAKIEVVKPLATALEISTDDLFSFENKITHNKENILLIKEMTSIPNKQDVKMLEILRDHIKNLDTTK
jgi:DNA-binding XRE family transcriptional regulator